MRQKTGKPPTASLHTSRQPLTHARILESHGTAVTHIHAHSQTRTLSDGASHVPSIPGLPSPPLRAFLHQERRSCFGRLNRHARTYTRTNTGQRSQGGEKSAAPPGRKLFHLEHRDVKTGLALTEHFGAGWKFPGGACVFLRAHTSRKLQRPLGKVWEERNRHADEP